MSEEAEESPLTSSNVKLSEAGLKDKMLDDSFDVNDNLTPSDLESSCEITTKSGNLLPEFAISNNNSSSSEPLNSQLRTQELHSPGGTVVSKRFYSPVRLDRELTPDSLVLDTSQELLEHSTSPRSLERSEMRFQIGIDKRVSSESGSSTPSQTSDSPILKSDLFVDIRGSSGSSSPVERSEYYAPPKLERELTPEPSSQEVSSHRVGSPDSLHRSEMHFKINSQKESNGVSVSAADILTQAEITVDVDEPKLTDDIVEKTDASVYDSQQKAEDAGLPIDGEVGADTSLNSLAQAAQQSIESLTNDSSLTGKVTAGSLSFPDGSKPDGAVEPPEISVTETAVSPDNESSASGDQALAATDTKTTTDGIEPDSIVIGDESSSISSEGMEYSRKQMTETEEVIETSVSSLFSQK